MNLRIRGFSLRKSPLEATLNFGPAVAYTAREGWYLAMKSLAVALLVVAIFSFATETQAGVGNKMRLLGQKAANEAEVNPSTKEHKAWQDLDLRPTGVWKFGYNTRVFYLKNTEDTKLPLGGTTTDDLVLALQQVKAKRSKVSYLEIKGHGAPEMQSMAGGTFFIATKNSVIAKMRDGSDLDITPLLLEATFPDAKIDLNGCHTAGDEDNVARNMSKALPGRTIVGGARYQISIPGTAKAFGSKVHYKNGKAIAVKPYRVD